jgi:type I restriction enzyme S subunit
VSELPVGWDTATIGDLIASDGIFRDGDWVETKDQDPDGDVRLTQLADIGDGFFRDRSSRFLTSESAAHLGCTFLETADVLIARMPDPLGRACLFPAILDAASRQDVCIARPGSASADPRWLMRWINTPKFRGDISALQAGTTEADLPEESRNHRVPAAAAERAAADRGGDRGAPPALDAADASLDSAAVRLETLLLLDSKLSPAGETSFWRDLARSSTVLTHAGSD